MKMNVVYLYLAVAAWTFAACGGHTSRDATESPSEDQSAMAAEHEMRDSGEQLGGACGLLSREQVDAVIPGNDGGQERDASEAALLTDVDIDFCRYFHVEGTDMKFLDLLVYRASSDVGFEQIEIGKWAHQGSNRALDIGDAAFLIDMSDQNEMMVTASKGRTVFELKLVSDDAPAKSEQLIDLARTVSGEI